jgi:hypothetical protein
MSSAFYPLGFKTYNNHVPQGGYKSWKGKGKFALPVGMTATHIRPLTNKDPGNCFSPGFGLPRPLQHYRRGTLQRTPQFEEILQTYPEIAYNLDRSIKSSHGSSLGGKNNGLMAHLMDSPAGYVVKDNTTDSPNFIADCKECHGIAIIDNTLPIPSLTETPERNVESRELCCNEERKAERMVLPTKTMLSKRYYQTTYAKLYNRCNTFQQKQFNYKSGQDHGVAQILSSNPLVAGFLLRHIKPGSPLATQFEYQYVGQCNPNFVVDQAAVGSFLNGLSKELYGANKITEDQYKSLLNLYKVEEYLSLLSTILPYEQYTDVVKTINSSAASLINADKDCGKVIYKPNNYKYAQQGAVTASTRILQLNVETINKNLYQMERGFNYKEQLCKPKHCPVPTLSYITH